MGKGEKERGNVLKCQYSHAGNENHRRICIALDGTYLSDFPSAHAYTCVFEERDVYGERREGRCGGEGMKDARFTRFRFAINSGVRTCGFVLYGLRDIILYSHVYIFTPESVADGQHDNIIFIFTLLRF